LWELFALQASAFVIAPLRVPDAPRTAFAKGFPQAYGTS